jgi:hypothetical protein
MSNLDKEQKIDLMLFLLSRVEIGLNEKNVFVIKRFSPIQTFDKDGSIMLSIENKSFSLKNIIIVFEIFCKKGVSYEEIFSLLKNE